MMLRYQPEFIGYYMKQLQLIDVNHVSLLLQLSLSVYNICIIFSQPLTFTFHNATIVSIFLLTYLLQKSNETGHNQVKFLE